MRYITRYYNKILPYTGKANIIITCTWLGCQINILLANYYTATEFQKD